MPPRAPVEPEPSAMSLTSPVVRPLATAVYWSGARSILTPVFRPERNAGERNRVTRFELALRLRGG